MRLLNTKWATLAGALVMTLALAACGGSSPPQRAMTDPALGIAKTAALAAAAAAEAAVAAQAENKDADPVSYALAEDAARRARAASDAAQAATDTAAAQAEQDKAEAAQAYAETRAGMVAEYAAVDDAQMKAADAAKAAMKAAEDAQAAVDAVKDNQSADQTSFDMAKAKADAADQAYMDAKAASEAAASATTSADAEAQRDIATQKQTDAETALTDATKYAGMVTGAHTEATDLAYAKQMAKQAADDARQAATDAQEAADEIDGLDSPLATAAQGAADDADRAAIRAEEANDRAQKATTSEAAEAEQMVAEGHRDTAQGHRDTAQGHQTTAENSKSEADMLMTEKTEAGTAATEARTAATEARTAADRVATLLGEGSDAAKAADMAATKAEEAADKAEAANTKAQAATTSAEAKAHREDADAEQKIAATQLAEAKRLHELAASGTDAASTLAIARIGREADAYVDMAKGHYEAAKQKASDAQGQVTRANNAVAKAESARTDATNAKKQAMEAMKAKAAADAAVQRAMAAYNMAMTAADEAEAATTVTEAEAKRKEAMDQNAIATEAHTGKTGAGMAYMSAMDAAGMAEKYASTHVVGLLKMANADHITTADDPDANRDETEVGLIEKNRLAHVAAVNTAVHITAGGPLSDRDPALTGVANQRGGTVTASHPYYGSLGDDNAFGGTDANADTGPGEGLLTISVDPTDGGEAIALIHAGPGPDGEAGTNDDIEANSESRSSGLGAFAEMYFGRNNDTDNDGAFDVGESHQHIILFTDIEQASDPIPGEVVSYFGEPVVQSRIATVNTATPVAETERDYNATYDHDGIKGTAPIAVVLNCGTSCNLRVLNGEVVSISGYTFSTAGDVTVPGVAPVPDDTYLAFGVWLTETAAAGVNTYTFGAFADGDAAIGDTDEPSAVASVTGDARYTGKAAGVHSTAKEVNFFHGDARLDAEFGNGTDIGTITGMIHNIMTGGETDPNGNIYLVVADPGAANPSPNIVDGGAFSGRARMRDTGENDSSGEDVYRYTGTWAGNFYNHMENDPNTANVDESTKAPGSVAGTFGVTRADVSTTMDIDETESYVGAFGAHCSGSNCNPH